MTFRKLLMNTDIYNSDICTNVHITAYVIYYVVVTGAFEKGWYSPVKADQSLRECPEDAVIFIYLFTFIYHITIIAQRFKLLLRL